ncbi:MAG: DUF4340 domain-containing protein [Clostridia bacterium]|nr:DUF4340 domain-containing protein [Clostridia bacterium]
MLGVKKKKQRGGGRRSLFLILLILLAAGGTVAALLLRAENTPLPAREEKGGAILTEDPGPVRRVTLRVRGREAWTAERGEDGVLRRTGDESWALDENRAEQLTDALENLVYEEILTEDAADYQDRLEDFGLADPALTAEVTYEDGSRLVFRIGDASALKDADVRFMTVEGDDRLYAVAGSLMEDLGTEAEVLRGVTQPEIQTARLDRIRVLDGEERLIAEWALDGEITDPDAAAAWTVRTDAFRYPADQDRMSLLKKNAGNLLLGLYIADAAEGDDLSAWGLDRPRNVIELHMAAGTTGQAGPDGALDVTRREEETVRFVIGNERNEMTFYALYNGTVCTMNRFTVTALTDADPLSTASRYPVVVPLEALESLTVEGDGRSDTWRLSRTALPAENGEEPEGNEITCEKNGEAWDYEAFSAAYQRAMVVTVSGTLPEGWEKRESTRVYIFRTLGGKTVRAELSPFDAMHDALTVDGETLFYVSHTAVQDLF